MIPITPIAGRTILLDADLIEAVEITPETVLVLVDHQRMVVVDAPETIVARVNRLRASRLAAAASLHRTRDAHVIPFTPKAVAG